MGSMFFAKITIFLIGDIIDADDLMIANRKQAVLAESNPEEKILFGDTERVLEYST
jgi:hypothetical protein